MAQKNVFPPVSFDEFPIASYDDWKAQATAALKGGDFSKRLTTKTYEGITLQPIYTKENIDSLSSPDTFPGYWDFVRGTQVAGYIQKPWDIAQSVIAASLQDTNALIKHELKKGATAINLRLGCDGLQVETAEDVKTLLKDINLSDVKLHVHCGSSAINALKLFDAAKTCFKNAGGCVGADPIGTLAADGCLSKSLEDFYKDMAESVKFAAEKSPALRTVLVDGNVYANGGADSVTEVACCMSTAAAYIEAMVQNGLDVDSAAKSIRFSFSLGANFFMEIAKLRAARVVFAQIVSAFGGSDEAQKIEVFARTSSFTKTIYDPYVNVLRSTTEAFAGVVGGIDAMEVVPLDEPYGESIELSRRIARNIQIMFQNEFNLLQPVDPAGGSWYVETLTSEIAQSIWSAFQKIDAAGGIVASLQSGAVQQGIAKTLADRFGKLANRSDRAVGTNMYANILEKRLERKPIDKAKCECTPVVSIEPILPHRWTEQYEELRGATERYQTETGKTLKVFLANMGPLSQHKARADFSCGFFEVAGFEMLRNDGYMTVDEAASAAVSSGAEAAVICSTDDTYPELVPPLAKAIKAAAPKMMVLLAGAPAPEHKQSYLDAGVDEFIHVRANCYDVLKKIQSVRGIR
jgi:methylmalonyl-CoA mutase